MIDITIKKRLLFSEGSKDLVVNHQVAPGLFLSVCGKSGAGKTTLLRILAGLTRPDSGCITAQGKVWYDDKKNVHIRPQDRNVGFVFQDFALFPNMTVRENLNYSLFDRNDKKCVEELLEITGLSALSSRRTHQLSGGQQQRVALARALVRRPQLLLLDEPLSSLDHETRILLQAEILNMHTRFGLTSILVSHDNDEIIRLSDYVIKMDSGVIIERGTPHEIFGQPFTSTIRLEGIITGVVESGSLYILQIRSGSVFNEITLNGQQLSDLRPGDRILFTAGSSDPVIEKLG